MPRTLAVLCLLGATAAFAQGASVQATTPPEARPSEAGTKSWGDVHKSESEAKYAETRAAAEKKPEEKKGPELKPPKISGYVQPDFTLGTGLVKQQGNFFLRRLRIKFVGEVLVPEIGYTIMIDPVASRPLFDGFVSLKYLPNHEVKVGQMKVHFGWENPASSTVLPLIERAVVSDQLGRGPNLRDLGVGLFGSFKLSEDSKLEHGWTLVNGAGANNLENTPKKDLFGRVGWVYGKWLKVGASGASVQQLTGTTSVVKDTSFRLGADLQVDYGPVFFVAEYLHGFFTDPTEHERNGFHATLVGRLPGDFDVVARYEQYSPDLKTDAKTQRRLVGGVTYYLYKPNLKLMVNYRQDLASTQNHLLLAQGQLIF